MKLGILLFVIANIMAWFQFNSQFVWKWFIDKPLTTNAIFAIPMGVCYWYAIKHVVADTGELWASKIIGFGIGNIVFAVLTWIIVRESIFTWKTMICLSLACLVVILQIFWK